MGFLGFLSQHFNIFFPFLQSTWGGENGKGARLLRRVRAEQPVSRETSRDGRRRRDGRPFRRCSPHRLKEFAVIKKLLFVLAGLSVVLLTACNTIEGMGKDIQKAGESIEGAAKKK